MTARVVRCGGHESVCSASSGLAKRLKDGLGEVVINDTIQVRV